MGANVHSQINDEYWDNPKFWAIFEMAEKLEVPIYIHPREPSPDMLKAYLGYPGLWASMWGYGAAGGLCAVRLILSGLFDMHPGLQVILGHMGEALPFWLGRLDGSHYSRRISQDKGKKKPSDIFKSNFLITISGMLYVPAFFCAYLALGAERLLFAVDSPYGSGEETVKFVEHLFISDQDKEKIFHSNAEKWLRLGRRE